jgi:hypothetical protein
MASSIVVTTQPAFLLTPFPEETQSLELDYLVVSRCLFSRGVLPTLINLFPENVMIKKTCFSDPDREVPTSARLLLVNDPTEDFTILDTMEKLLRGFGYNDIIGHMTITEAFTTKYKESVPEGSNPIFQRFVFQIRSSDSSSKLSLSRRELVNVEGETYLISRRHIPKETECKFLASRLAEEEEPDESNVEHLVVRENGKRGKSGKLLPILPRFHFSEEDGPLHDLNAEGEIYHPPSRVVLEEEDPDENHSANKVWRLDPERIFRDVPDHLQPLAKEITDYMNQMFYDPASRRYLEKEKEDVEEPFMFMTGKGNNGKFSRFG